jgi:DNA-binding transcriptional LysR family regulator
LPRNPELSQLAVKKLYLGAVMTPDHPLASRSTVKMSDCADYPLFMSDERLSLNKLLHPIIVQARRIITPTIEANSIELLKNLAERKLGIAFMSRIGLERALTNRSLVHIPLVDRGPVYTELGLYARADTTLSPAVDAFAQIAIAEMEHRARGE